MTTTTRSIYAKQEEAGSARPAAVVKPRNGKSAKTVLTDDGPLRIEVPRDRTGTVEPILIPEHERRFSGLDDKIGAPCTHAA